MGATPSSSPQVSYDYEDVNLDYGKERENKKYDVSISLMNTLNSGIIFPAFVSGKPVNIVSTYNRKTPALSVQMKFLRKGNISYKMFRKLDECEFANKYFQLENEETEREDFRSKFMGLNEGVQDELRQFKSEYHDLNKAFLGRDEKEVEAQPNYLYITGWELKETNDEFLFFLFERGLYHRNKDQFIVRVVGLQLANDREDKRVLEYF